MLKHKKSAFTLIELLIVVFILSSLLVHSGLFASRAIKTQQFHSRRLHDALSFKHTTDLLRQDIAYSASVELRNENRDIHISRLSEDNEQCEIRYEFVEGQYFRTALVPDMPDHQQLLIPNLKSIGWTKLEKGFELEMMTHIEDHIASIDREHKAWFAMLQSGNESEGHDE